MESMVQVNCADLISLLEFIQNFRHWWKRISVLFRTISSSFYNNFLAITTGEDQALLDGSTNFCSISLSISLFISSNTAGDRTWSDHCRMAYKQNTLVLKIQYHFVLYAFLDDI